MTAVLKECSSELGLMGRSRFLDRIKDKDMGIQIKVPPPERYRPHRVGGSVRRFALPVTFTPFASVNPCSARCVFCSETLWHRNARILSASIRPGPHYFEGLAAVLSEIRGVPIGISLSGLEATDNADWLEPVLDLLEEHERLDGQIEEKVLYSNGAGLARETTGARLLPRLNRFGLSRIEFSRHHHEQSKNDPIMRFRPDKPIRFQPVFDQTVRDAIRWVPVRLVCVLQKGGVSNWDDVRAYLTWAASLGVKDIVFREFSRLGGLYRPNRTWRTIKAQRVILEDLLDEVCPDRGQIGSELEPLSATAGYYYWNVQFKWRHDVKVTFETSDYTEMKDRHESGVVHKLIYHANGNLCGDWDPEKEVLLRTGDSP